MSANPHTTNHHDHADHPAVGHVSPLWSLISVWLALMVLTYVTVAVTNYDLGAMNLVIAMVIATIKAALVVLFFMHLYWDRPFNAVVFIVALSFVALFVIWSMMDTHEYRHQMIHSYQPAIEFDPNQ